MFLDYWNVYISLVCTLKNSGSDIWWQTRDADQQYKNIFQNLSNPNFPQDKVLDTLIELIVTNPYSPEYYEFDTQYLGAPNIMNLRYQDLVNQKISQKSKNILD